MGRMLLLAVLLGLVAGALYRMRAARRAWVRSLRLVGRWVSADGEHGHLLELRGGPDGGQYVERETVAGAEQAMERGDWHLSGHSLVLEPENGGAEACELRAFGDGSIGLHGPRHARRIYRRVPAEVTPLRSRG